MNFSNLGKYISECAKEGIEIESVFVAQVGCIALETTKEISSHLFLNNSDSQQKANIPTDLNIEIMEALKSDKNTFDVNFIEDVLSLPFSFRLSNSCVLFEGKPYHLRVDIPSRFQKYTLKKDNLEKKAIELNHDDFVSHYLLGTINILLKKKKQAIKEYRKCISLRPNNLLPYYLLALIFLMDEDYPNAFQYFNIINKKRKNQPREREFFNFAEALLPYINGFYHCQSEHYTKADKFIYRFCKVIKESKLYSLDDFKLLNRIFEIDRRIRIVSATLGITEPDISFGDIDNIFFEITDLLSDNVDILQNTGLLDLILAKFQIFFSIIVCIGYNNDIPELYLKIIKLYDTGAEKFRKLRNIDQIYEAFRTTEYIPIFAKDIFQKLNYNHGINCINGYEKLLSLLDENRQEKGICILKKLIKGIAESFSFKYVSKYLGEKLLYREIDSEFNSLKKYIKKQEEIMPDKNLERIMEHLISIKKVHTILKTVMEAEELKQVLTHEGWKTLAWAKSVSKEEKSEHFLWIDTSEIGVLKYSERKYFTEKHTKKLPLHKRILIYLLKRKEEFCLFKDLFDEFKEYKKEKYYEHDKRQRNTIISWSSRIHQTIGEDFIELEDAEDGKSGYVIRRKFKFCIIFDDEQI